MSQTKATYPDSDESVRHAQWVREHSQLDDSGFPEYPDEPMRRGASRGAVPNGNPWRPIEPDEKPGRPEWEEDTVPAPLRSDVAPAGSVSAPSQSDAVPVATPEPPPLGEPTHRPAIVSAQSEADQKIGCDVGDVLATSKMLDGIHLLVEVVDGDVYLHGTVADEAVKGEVERLVSSVRGSKRIYNELNVRRAHAS